MKTVVPPIPFAGSQLSENRDVCAFFNGDDEAYRVLLPFTKGGFECSDKAVHVVAPDQRPDHLRRFAGAGIDTMAAQQSGQFELRTNTKSCLQDRRFDLDRMLEVFEQVASGTAKGRFPLNRMAPDTDWAAELQLRVNNRVERS